MHARTRLATTLLAAFALTAGTTAFAKVTQEQADRLLPDGDLTPLGGEKAGNEDGTIPAFGGGLKSSEAPERFKGLNTRYYDPWPDDEPEFVISNSNLAEHKSKLTPGQVELDQVALTQLLHRDAQHLPRRRARGGRQQQLERRLALPSHTDAQRRRRGQDSLSRNRG